MSISWIEKKYTGRHPSLAFDHLFNFRILIKLFIHEVKKTSKFGYSGYICLININNLDFNVYHGISL